MYVSLSTYARNKQFDQKILSQYKYLYFVCLRKQLYLAIVSKLNDEKKIQDKLFKRGEGTNSPLHPHYIRRNGGAHDPLHPSLDTGLGKTYILILFLSNLHMPIVMFQPYFFIKIVILFLNYMHITFSVISFVFILLYVPIYDYVPNSCTV